MSECSEELRAADKPYPRTCAICGIGSCIKRHAPAVQPTELETLRAENARLRKALEAIANQAMHSEYASETILEIIELASAALAATKGEK